MQSSTAIRIAVIVGLLILALALITVCAITGIFSTGIDPPPPPTEVVVITPGLGNSITPAVP